jgi:hypothetical protein
MEKQCFTVYDSAAQHYLEPFFAPSVEFAIREFRSAVNTPEHQFNKFPEDFTLFHIGTFEPESGVLNPVHPHSLGVAITFLDRQMEVMDG